MAHILALAPLIAVTMMRIAIRDFIRNKIISSIKTVGIEASERPIRLDQEECPRRNLRTVRPGHDRTLIQSIIEFRGT
jgi:hypothetical protein